MASYTWRPGSYQWLHRTCKEKAVTPEVVLLSTIQLLLLLTHASTTTSLVHCCEADYATRVEAVEDSYFQVAGNLRDFL